MLNNLMKLIYTLYEYFWNNFKQGESYESNWQGGGL